MSKVKTVSRTARRTGTTTNTTVSVDRALVQDTASRIARLVSRNSGEWTGTMTGLSTAITARGISRTVPVNFPKSASYLRRVVNATVATLRRNYGVRTVFSRTTDHSRTRLVNFVSSR